MPPKQNKYLFFVDALINRTTKIKKIKNLIKKQDIEAKKITINNT